MLNASFGRRGFEFVHVSRIVPPGTEDEVWADVFRGSGGQITISADKNIAKKPHKVVAFIDNGFKSFFMQPPWSQAPGKVKLAHLTYWWHNISTFYETCDPGCCWQVPFDYRDEVLRLSSSPLKALKVPDQVLAKARTARA